MHELLGPLLLFAVAVTFTPGPNVVLVTASAANFGFRRTLPQVLGITAGFGTMILATGLGLAGLLHAEPRLHALLKYAGAAYLAYLAWRIARTNAGAGVAERGKPIGFLEAALFTWTNPKAWMSGLGALAAYRTADGDPEAETALIACVLAGACLASAMLWAGFGMAIGRFIASPRARRTFNWSMAGLLVISLIPVLR
jgi:threonine/homoserine/homoserine lactone efflux protein